MKDELQFKCLSVGMRGEKATEEDPIHGRHLYVMPPGESRMRGWFKLILTSQSLLSPSQSHTDS